MQLQCGRDTDVNHVELVQHIFGAANGNGRINLKFLLGISEFATHVADVDTSPEKVVGSGLEHIDVQVNAVCPGKGDPFVVITVCGGMQPTQRRAGEDTQFEGTRPRILLGKGGIHTDK